MHPLERIDCSAGEIHLADRVIKDAHENGVLTFTDVIAESSNVGTIKVALRLGKERFAKYITAFGFGKKTGVDIPGEISGLLKDQQPVVRRIHRLHRHRPGDRRNADPDGLRVLRPRERRHAHEAVHRVGDRRPRRG